jgi:DNA-binding response OmpR family regulator
VKTMPVVFVIAADWTMRTAVRAELRELGIDALGMDSADDAGLAIASGGLPIVVVLEATADLLGNLRIQILVKHVPTVLIASRTERVSLPDTAAVLYRPVLIAEIVAHVRELLARNHAA